MIGRSTRGAALTGLLASALALCSACSSPVALSPSASAVPHRSAATATTADYPFSAGTFWRTPITDAPLDPASAAKVARLVGTITDRYNGTAAFNAHQYNSHFYTATASTPTVDFAFDDCQKKGYTPDGLLGESGQFTAVPVPAGAVPAVGTDGELTVYSPATDQLWEFWKAAQAADGGWSACWGGRLDHVSTGPGYFPAPFGATATGLPNAGGAVRLAEVRAGRIDHAISLSIPDPAIASVFSWPAQRSDGTDSDPAAMPEGSRLRLDPTLDLSTLDLSPAARTIAQTAQRYGFVVVDGSYAVSVIAEAVEKANGLDPWFTELGTPDYAVLKHFPWSRLQVVERDYGKPAA